MTSLLSVAMKRLIKQKLHPITNRSELAQK